MTAKDASENWRLAQLTVYDGKLELSSESDGIIETINFVQADPKMQPKVVSLKFLLDPKSETTVTNSPQNHGVQTPNPAVSRLTVVSDVDSLAGEPPAKRRRQVTKRNARANTGNMEEPSNELVTQQEKFHCSFCPNKYSHERSLDHHFQTHPACLREGKGHTIDDTDVVSKNIACSTCGKVLLSDLGVPGDIKNEHEEDRELYT